MRTLAVGEPVPDLERLDQHGAVRRLTDARGRWLVLTFYLWDDTPTCTIQTRTFQSLLTEFERLGAWVWGASTQDGPSHAAFAEKCGLTFPLLADADKELQRAFGLRSLYGATKRVTFLIDPEGRVADAYRNEFRGDAHVEWALRHLRRLAVAARPADPGP